MEGPTGPQPWLWPPWEKPFAPWPLSWLWSSLGSCRGLGRAKGSVCSCRHTSHTGSKGSCLCAKEWLGPLITVNETQRARVESTHLGELGSMETITRTGIRWTTKQCGPILYSIYSLLCRSGALLSAQSLQASVYSNSRVQLSNTFNSNSSTLPTPSNKARYWTTILFFF